MTYHVMKNGEEKLKRYYGKFGFVEMKVELHSCSAAWLGSSLLSSSYVLDDIDDSETGRVLADYASIQSSYAASAGLL